MRVGALHDGAKGFDVNQRLSRADALAARDFGMEFVIRYVRRDAPHAYDISTGEVYTILNAGLALMLVQHVAQEGLLGMVRFNPILQWSPSKTLGKTYGSIAAQEARAVGYLHGANLWCDLEGVSHRSTPEDVILYCNSWFDAVKAAGFEPGLYVGYDSGISASDLYHKLKFSHYWAAYNLNVDSYPLVRGVQMQQGAYPAPTHRIPGVRFEYDTDLIHEDAKGGSPLLVLPK